MMEEEISLRDILNLLKRNIGKIFTITFAVVLLAVLATAYLMTPQYQASTQLLVNQPAEENILTTGTIQTSTQLISTYREIVLSTPIIEETLNEMETTDVTVDEAREMIAVNSTAESQIFSIDVQTPDPEFSADLANGLADTFGENIEDIFEVDNVSIIARAEVPANPSSPSLLRNMLIAGLIGIALSILLIFIQEALDTTIKDEKFFSEIGLLALGGVNQMSKQEKSKTFFRPSVEDRKSFAEQEHRQRGDLELADLKESMTEAPTRIIHRNRTEA